MSLVRTFHRSFHSTRSCHSTTSLDEARRLLSDRHRILAITGAGLSTESGIPDYRSPGRPPHRPTSHQTFMASHATRQRYWARSMGGYETLARSLPNAGHYALSYAERGGRILGVITQNVDLLHEGAGSQEVLHLHGTVREVRCMSCEALSSRKEFQASLREFNRTFLGQRFPKDPIAQLSDHQISPGLGVKTVAIPHARHSVAIPANQRPDGDSDLAIHDFSSFIVPSCKRCTDGFGLPLPHVTGVNHLPDQPAGILKPDLVFFGANVPKPVHARADQLLEQADALLIAGTSLTVWSAFRLVRAALDRAAPGRTSVVQVAEQLSRLRPTSPQSSGGNSIEDGRALLAPVTPFQIDLATDSSYPQRVPATLPVIILNHGPTRADPLMAAADWGIAKVEARTGEALHALLEVPREATIEMEQEVRRRHLGSGTQPLKDSAHVMQDAMRHHANIE